MVGLTNGGDLLEVMPAVHELEHAPLVYIERAEDRVGGELGGAAEEGFGLAEEQVEMGEVFRSGMGEVFAGEWLGDWLRRDHGRRFAARGEVSATRDCVLKDALLQG